MKIYTRTGDKGQTSLFSGERVSKADLRVEAYGTLDELNAALGAAAQSCRNQRILELISLLQNQLFVAGADLATRPGGRFEPERIGESDWRDQETIIDELTEALPRLKHFVLPGGSAGSALLQWGRAVCRRAERLIVRLAREEGEVNPQLLVYVNRLSDLLFVMARYENVVEGGREVIWKGRKERT